MHFRYANVMNQIFVAFTHGLVLPLLFPIAFLNIMNMFIVEKLQFTYWYRQPPLMDNKLNARALSILQFAPVMMVFFGYWQLGNRQMFHNETMSLVHSSQKILTQHDAIYFSEFTSAHLFLFFLPVMILNSKRVQLISKILGKIKYLKDLLNVQ